MTIIVCKPLKPSCWCCDSTYPQGDEMIVLPNGRVYCSVDCHDDWEDYLARQDEADRLRKALCPECGYDNQEHNPATCSKATERDRRREGLDDNDSAATP